MVRCGNFGRFEKMACFAISLNRPGCHVTTGRPCRGFPPDSACHQLLSPPAFDRSHGSSSFSASGGRSQQVWSGASACSTTSTRSSACTLRPCLGSWKLSILYSHSMRVRTALHVPSLIDPSRSMARFTRDAPGLGDGAQQLTAQHCPHSRVSGAMRYVHCP